MHKAVMMKEYNFLCNIRDKIERKAEKIYSKQIKKEKVLKYHCNYTMIQL